MQDLVHMLDSSIHLCEVFLKFSWKLIRGKRQNHQFQVISHGAAWEAKEAMHIPIYQFKLLRNIQTFVWTWWIWEEYFVFLIATYVITRLLLGEIYPSLEISIWLNVNCILLVEFILDLINFSQISDGHELAQTSTLLSQTKRLTKCVSQLESST